MTCFSANWKMKWESRKKEVLNRNFNVSDVVNFQSNGGGAVVPRDMEVLRLRSSDAYHHANEIFGDQGSAPIFACKFCPRWGRSNIVAAVDEDGNVSIHDTRDFGNALCVSRGHNNAVFDVVWVPGEEKLLTMAGDNTARLWDVGEAGITLISTFSGHTKSVKTADFQPSDPAIFATGSRDGNILLWDSRSSHRQSGSVFKPDQVIAMAAGHVQRKGERQYSPCSVTALAFQDKNTLICCGSTDKLIRVWDMRKTHCAWKVSEPKTVMQARRPGFTDLKLSPERTKLYVSCINDSILCYNLNSPQQEPIAEFSGREANTFYVRMSLSADGEYLVSGSTDRSVCVWKTASAQLEATPRMPMLRLPGHTAEVTGVDISQARRTELVTCADDGTLRLWSSTATLIDDGARDPLQLNARLAQLGLDEKWKNSAEPYENLSSESTARIEHEVIGPLPKEDAAKEDRSHGESSNNLGSTSKFCSLKLSPRRCTASRMSDRQRTPPPAKAVRTDEARVLSGKRKLQETSPTRPSSCDSKRIVLSPSKANTDYQSPTLNLPNYVAEGSGPSHSCPRMRQKENTDWLTEMRQRSAGKPPAIAGKVGRRRSHQGKQSSRKTLLEYYKKSSKGTDESAQKT